MCSAIPYGTGLRIWLGFGSQEHSGTAAGMVDSSEPWEFWRDAYNTEPGKAATSENSHPGPHGSRVDTIFSSSPPTSTPAAGNKGSSQGLQHPWASYWLRPCLTWAVSYWLHSYWGGRQTTTTRFSRGLRNTMTEVGGQRIYQQKKFWQNWWPGYFQNGSQRDVGSVIQILLAL